LQLMNNNFEIEDVSPGDILIAHDTWNTVNGKAPLAHTWIVLNNEYDDQAKDGYINVYVMYSQAPHDQAYSFYYKTFKRYQKMALWSLQHVS